MRGRRHQARFRRDFRGRRGAARPFRPSLPGHSHGDRLSPGGAKREIHDLLWRIREKDGVSITIVYLLSGFLAAFGGILFTSRMSSGQPTTGANWVMPCITAAIIGGTSLSGGEGSILGTVLGALFMGVLANGIVHMDISPYWERIIIGLVVVLAVVIDVLRTRKRSRS